MKPAKKPAAKKSVAKPMDRSMLMGAKMKKGSKKC
jgi:hypothetical protein